MTDCFNQGVPLPPPWGDDRWVKKGEISPVFASSLPKTEVWVSKSPNGVCFALPRIQTGVKPPECPSPPCTLLLGQICQNSTTGKTCFWDNKSPSDGATGVKVKNGLDPANLAGADKLQENCTDCHRGENAFIIHPDTALDLGSENPCGTGKGQTDVPKGTRYTPLGAPKFKNPPVLGATLTTDPKNEGCLECHVPGKAGTLPTLNYSYCNTVLGLRTKDVPPPRLPSPRMA